MEIVRLFIENGADVNAKTRDGESPIHYVCKYCVDGISLIHAVQLLIEKGADVNSKNLDEWT